MKGERILSRKFNKINRLKKELVSRSQGDCKEIIEDIKEATDDLEAVLIDLGYLGEEEVYIESSEVRTYRCFRDECEFTLEDLKKYNGEKGMPLYIAVGENVYDLSELLDNRNEETIEEIIEEIKNNEELLKNFTIVGKVKE